MFFNKNKNTTENTDNTKNAQWNWNNIFLELSWDINFLDDKSVEKDQEKKTAVYYVLMSTNICFIVILISLLVSVLWFTYIKMQKEATLTQATYLDSICGVFLPKDLNVTSNCSSITFFLNDIKAKIEAEEVKILSSQLNLVPDIFSILDISTSPESVFLLKNSKSRLWVFEIIRDFEKLKTTFFKNNNQIECKNYKIDKSLTLSMICDIYASSSMVNTTSTYAELNSLDLDFGSSATIASAFLDYLEKNNEVFKITQKQKSFNSEETDSEYDDLKTKTTVELELKYVKTENLSL